MHEKSPVLRGELRERLGTRYAKRMREQGRLPAVVYGHGKEPTAISVDAKETIRHIKSGERVFTIELAGKKETVLLRDVQFDYLGDGIVHCDLSRVDLDEVTHAHVHVVLKGEAIGLKTVGTLLMHPVTELTVECKLRDLPGEIVVNVSDLNVGGIIHASDIALPEGVKLRSDPGAILAQVTHVGAEEATGEAATVEAGTQPEVIRERKPGDE